MDPSTVDVKHDPKVDGYAAQNCKAVNKSPVGGIQGDLTRQEGEKTDRIFYIKAITNINILE